MAIARESFWAHREHFRALMRSRYGGGAGSAAGAALQDSEGQYEAAAGPLPLDERLIQTIWAHQLIQAEGLRTADGRPLRVLDAGRWNGQAGPDFREARIMLGDATLLGDIEIHINASEWARHGHARDLEYNRVVLHAVLTNDDGRASDTLHNGREAPRLVIEPYIFPDLETLRRSLTSDDYAYARPAYVGRCHELMTDADPVEAADFLDRAGDERLIAKVRRLDEQLPHGDLEQVFYQAMMMSLGSGPGKTLYYLLAKRTPIAELMDFVGELDPAQWPLAIESLLLNVAGLVPGENQPLAQTEIEIPDDDGKDMKGGAAEAGGTDSRDHAARLGALWKRFEPFWSDRIIPPTRRWYQGIRPVNFPCRRLAGVASIITHAMRRRAASGNGGGSESALPLADLLTHLRAGAGVLESAVPQRRKHPVLHDLIDWFRVGGEGNFWGTHYSFTARPAARQMDLIGESTALSLVFNAFIPAAVLAARRAGDTALEAAAHKLYCIVPPLQSNHITEFMTRRLFGESERAAQLITTERRRQALFQIFYACCNGEALHCDLCYYLTGKG